MYFQYAKYNFHYFNVNVQALHAVGKKFHSNSEKNKSKIKIKRVRKYLFHDALKSSETSSVKKENKAKGLEISRIAEI